MGRKLYSNMAAYWPSSIALTAAPMNQIPKAVFSYSALRKSDVREPGRKSGAAGGTTRMNQIDSVGAMAFLVSARSEH